MILQREDPVGMSSGLLHVAPLQRHHLPLRGLVVDAQQPVLAGRGELAAVVEVVQAEDLVALLHNTVEALARFDVPLHDLTVKLRVDGDQDALRLGGRRVGPPAQLRGGQRRLGELGVGRGAVQEELLASCLGAVDVNGAIGEAGGQVLVVRREAHAEAVRHRSVAGVHCILRPDAFRPGSKARHLLAPLDGHRTTISSSHGSRCQRTKTI
mmetsp:Transcript_62909/g.99781  ORF Transcript_62909/g.99781 Transcript_62909/m.99781 type:complete len:211 (-) Transcript_62909:8-640(-)